MSERITLSKVQNIIDRLNENYKLKLSLDKGEESGTVVLMSDCSTPIIEDNLRGVKNYLHGIEYGLIYGNVTKEPEVTLYFKKKIGSKITAVVSKVAKNTYHSQEKRYFVINILDVKNGVVFYQAYTYNTCPSGVRVGNTEISSQVLQFALDDNISLMDIEEKVLDKMVEAIDTNIKQLLIEQKQKKVIDYINSDMIVDIKEKDLSHCGWTNSELVTVRYSVNYTI